VIKKLQIQLDYPPTLHVFSRMDNVALKLAHRFPDWERNPNAIELRNWEQKQLLRIGFKESYFCCDDPPVLDDEVQLCLSCIEQIVKRFELRGPLKVSAGIQMISEYEGLFEELVSHLHKKFHTQLPTIPGFDTVSVTDVAYVVDFKDRGSIEWQRKLSAGPMNRQEWLLKNPLTLRASDLAGALMDRHKISVPPVFIFASLDGIREGMRSNQLHDAVPKIISSSVSMGNSFFSFCKA
jgi:hypothetical protein